MCIRRKILGPQGERGWKPQSLPLGIKYFLINWMYYEAPSCTLFAEKNPKPSECPHFVLSCQID